MQENKRPSPSFGHTFCPSAKVPHDGEALVTETPISASEQLSAQRRERKLRIQLVLAVVLAAFGMLLFVVSFVVPPTGIIDSSVLVAGGEVFIFSGTPIGVDYTYKARNVRA